MIGTFGKSPGAKQAHTRTIGQVTQKSTRFSGHKNDDSITYTGLAEIKLLAEPNRKLTYNETITLRASS